MQRPSFTLLISLSLFLILLPSTHAVATPAQCLQGRVEGSISAPSTGDWLSETTCECFPGGTRYDPAALTGYAFQWEYYNYHSNATFLMVFCDLSADLRAWRYGWLCRKYPLPDVPKHAGNRKTDEMCFLPDADLDLLLGFTDHLQWNGQQRDLSKYGNQGLSQRPEKWVNEHICPEMCEAFMKEEHGAHGSTGKGTQFVWDDVDDMCDNCR